MLPEETRRRIFDCFHNKSDNSLKTNLKVTMHMIVVPVVKAAWSVVSMLKSVVKNNGVKLVGGIILFTLFSVK